MSFLPGEDLVKQGMEDLSRNEETVAALLVSIGAPRLRLAGMTLPRVFPEADHRLYLALAREFGDDAHSRYNALVRRLISFEQALECTTGRTDRPHSVARTLREDQAGSRPLPRS
jgi:hypothetical protein